MHTGTAVDPVRLSSRSRRLQRRAIIFATACAVAGLLAGMGVFLVVEIYLPSLRLLETNRNTLHRIHCSDTVCDVTEIANDWEFDGAEYVVDRTTRFLLNFQPPTEGIQSPLHRSDASFLKQFEQPATFVSPSGEMWRLLSGEKQLGAHRILILVGYAAKVSWRMYLPSADFRAIDAQLKEQLAKIAGALRYNNGAIELPATIRTRLPADGYEIVDVKNNQIIQGGWWLPVFLPPDVRYPSDGISFFHGGSELYMARATSDERLTAVSTYLIGDWRTLVALFALLFLVSGLVGHIAATTVLRRYLVFSQTRPIATEDALKQGEGPSVEFKRGISFDVPNSVEQVLQTIAAFANTGDGTLFIGIEDDGKIRGLHVENQKARDSLSQRIYDVIRRRIAPPPAARVEFLETGGNTICRVFVPRGEEPLHFLDGVIYVRHGSSDVKAQPELVKRLLTEFAY